MKTTKIRKGEYKIALKGSEFIIMKDDIYNDGWNVYQDGELLFSHKSKTKAIRTLSNL